MNYNKIVVTGGSGVLGKSLQKILPEAIYLSSKDYDLTNEFEVDKMFRELQPDCLLILSAKVGSIVDNINKPAEYFIDNVLMNTLLINCAYKYKVNRILSVLSASAYSDEEISFPASEVDILKGMPSDSNYEYGFSKRCMFIQMNAYNKQYGTKYQCLIPSNFYSENDKFGENSRFMPSLIKKIHNSKINKSEKILLFGSGNPIRQFIYADDVAWLIKYCLDNDIYENMNVASRETKTIKEIAEIALKAMGADDLKIEFDTTKPDGQYRKDISIEKLENIIPNFNAISLSDGIKKTYEQLLINKSL